MRARLVPGGSQDRERMATAVKRLKSFRGTLQGLTLEQLADDRRDGQRF